MTDAVAETPRETNELRWLADAYYQTQKLRIAIGNRIGAAEREDDLGPVVRGVSKLYLDLRAGERALVRDMERSLEGHPAMPWLGRVKGVGPTLATKVLGLIGEIDTFVSLSQLWSFAGFAVKDGKRVSLEKGKKAPYSTRLKTVLYLVGGSFLKSGSPYRAIYDAARESYDRREKAKPKGEAWTLGHQHLASLRKMEKVFLSHLWQTWREAKGLPVRLPYCFDKMPEQHATFYDPWDFVEPE